MSLRASDVPWGCVRSVAVEFEPVEIVAWVLGPLFAPVTRQPANPPTWRGLGDTFIGLAGWRVSGLPVNTARWRLPPRQSSCLARGSDLQRRSRLQVVQDEPRSCWSTQVRTAAQTPTTPFARPSHDARASTTQPARAAAPQEPTRGPIRPCSTPWRRRVDQPRLPSSRSGMAPPPHAAASGSIAAPQHDTAAGRATVLRYA